MLIISMVKGKRLKTSFLIIAHFTVVAKLPGLRMEARLSVTLL